ncbi:VanW family protein [uncultured Meiothermus sp.]|jgi:vancomycin resistance protein YoaR|uniref:VanW family protein n=1 Tax=uncultured Meiothermus sp. TaxID=157471 RepID=UPI00262136D3|nr:VanW family protein [uncultured Meiothermus sp.]
MRALVPLLWLLSLALAGPVAVLVVDERVLEGGSVVRYTGVQRFPIASEAELQPLLRRLSRPPSPARFIYDRRRGWIAVQKFGYRFDLEAVRRAYRAAVELGRREFVLPVVVQEPQPSVEDLARSGIVELFGEARIGFAGSVPSRIHNIRLASSKLDSIQILRGAVFSFNRSLGPVTLAAGYQRAWVIVSDRTVWGVGGGVCHVSSTLFRAAYFAGLPILERHPHSYQIGFYRPTGLDAAVAPGRDLRFRNDTPADLLIQASIQEQALVFRLFGRRDRDAQWRGPVMVWRSPPLPARFIYDPTLPPGRRRQIDFAAEGALVRIYRTVRLHTGEIRQDVLVSRYRPWGAVFLVGPGSGSTLQNPAGK